LMSNGSGTSISQLRNTLTAQILTTTNGNTRTVTSHGVAIGSVNGWYVDLGDWTSGTDATPGERVNTTPVLYDGILSFTTNIPLASQCSPGGSSWLYNLNATTGAAYAPPGGATAAAGTSLGNYLASRVVMVTLPNGQAIGLVNLDGTVTANQSPIPVTSQLKRTSWRQLVQ